MNEMNEWQEDAAKVQKSLPTGNSFLCVSAYLCFYWDHVMWPSQTFKEAVSVLMLCAPSNRQKLASPFVQGLTLNGERWVYCVSQLSNVCLLLLLIPGPNDIVSKITFICDEKATVDSGPTLGLHDVCIVTKGFSFVSGSNTSKS